MKIMKNEETDDDEKMTKGEETGTMISLERGLSWAENNLWGGLKGTTDAGDR